MTLDVLCGFFAGLWRGSKSQSYHPYHRLDSTTAIQDRYTDSEDSPAARPLREKPLTKSRASVPRSLIRRRPASTTTSTADLLSTAAATMGPQPSTVVSTQQLRLLLELLPFRNEGHFNEWLEGEAVAGAWREFTTDFLTHNGNAPESDKNRVCHLARDAIHFRTAKFVLYHPNKDQWTADDHYVRFLTMVVIDSMLKGVWNESEWKRRGIDIVKGVYEALSYLRGTVEGVGGQSPGEGEPPRYEDIPGHGSRP